jgi:hypothetical protein
MLPNQTQTELSHVALTTNMAIILSYLLDIQKLNGSLRTHGAQIGDLTDTDTSPEMLIMIVVLEVKSF